MIWVTLFFYFIINSTLFAMNHSNEKSQDCPQLTGHVVFPNQAEYDKARLNSNFYSSKNLFPKAIVYTQSVEDVQNAVKWARCKHIPIRIRSGGHNHESFSSGSDALIIDVSEMKKIIVDKEKSQVTVEAGFTGGELYSKLFIEGLTQVGGTCKDVGISGLVLTGGLGPLVRKYGLTCDTLRSFEMVDANGNILHVTPNNEYKDLFWAACGGGGGNFGVVTSLVLQVYPAKRVTWFNIGWDWDQPIDAIISAWQNFFLNKDDSWFSHLDLWTKSFPSKKFNKQPIKVLGVYFGSPEVAKRELAPLLRMGQPVEQTIEFVTWENAIKLFEESTSVFITDKPEYKSTGAFAMKPLPQEAIKIIVEALRHSTSPLLNVLFLGLGGAAKNKSPNDTAFYYRESPFLITYSTQWLQQQDDKKHIAEIDALRQHLLPYTQGDYVGNPDRNLQDYLTSYFGTNVQKLRCIKKKYDPTNLFQFEQSIPPAENHCDHDKNASS